ncbi:hypothetical protein SK128_020146 [Halocaridina rubra]|uniref:Glutathione peroxidase n=1 Tax=Halocaridina rubra TaxID=373956 RepID=A0AAN9A3I8_HALRR
MARLLPFLVGAATLVTPSLGVITDRQLCGPVTGDFYQFSANTLNGSTPISFEDYRGKVVLVYNVATY